MKSILKKLRNICFADLARKEDLNILYRQFEGLLQIHRAMEGRAVLRPMRGWAMSPDAMTLILATIQEYENPTVVEFGSGQSTVMIAAVLKHSGGRLLSIEHDAEYSAIIQRQLHACGLAEIVQIVVTPLEKSSNELHSYSLSKLEPIPVNVALIDGPPIHLCGPEARLAPLIWAMRNLAVNGVVFLDDARRPGEQKCIDRVKIEFPHLLIRNHESEKGLAQLTLRSSDNLIQR